MNSLLICPKCKSNLELIPLSLGGESASAAANPRDGIFRCSCSALYPFVEGVPRLFRDALATSGAFLRNHRSSIERLCGGKAPDAAADEDEYANIRKSFSQEWSIFDYDHDKTWGWSLDERKKVFLGDVGMQREQLRGKRLLDAGCGNGTLTAALADFGMEIVGLDLNDGLGHALANRGKYSPQAQEHVSYVQGNLVEPPLRPQSFDLVYSSGVIHHTPSSKGTFMSLAPMVKRGGRLYVWVYRKRAFPVRAFFAVGRSLKRFISLRALMGVCRVLSFPYKMVASVLDTLGVARFRPRTTAEITLDLFDAFAPRYNHWHTEAELRSWFVEMGFGNVTASGFQKHGIGMYGDKL